MLAPFWVKRRGYHRTKETAGPMGRPSCCAVVGVAPNVHHYELRNQARVQAWVPFRQSLDNWQQFYFIAARSASGDAPALAQADVDQQPLGVGVEGLHLGQAPGLGLACWVETLGTAHPLPGEVTAGRRRIVEHGAGGVQGQQNQREHRQ